MLELPGSPTIPQIPLGEEIPMPTIPMIQEFDELNPGNVDSSMDDSEIAVDSSMDDSEIAVDSSMDDSEIAVEEWVTLLDNAAVGGPHVGIQSQPNLSVQGVVSPVSKRRKVTKPKLPDRILAMSYYRDSLKSLSRDEIFHIAKEHFPTVVRARSTRHNMIIMLCENQPDYTYSSRG
jgi:hypothetical protein